MIVDGNGRIVEFTSVGRTKPQEKPTRKWLAPSLKRLRELAEQRRMMDLHRELEHIRARKAD